MTDLLAYLLTGEPAEIYTQDDCEFQLKCEKFLPYNWDNLGDRVGRFYTLEIYKRNKPPTKSYIEALIPIIGQYVVKSHQAFIITPIIYDATKQKGWYSRPVRWKTIFVKDIPLLSKQERTSMEKINTPYLLKKKKKKTNQSQLSLF